VARERIATREAVFEAADQLVAMGQKPTVSAVRDEIGGGSNTTIQDLLGDWRREKQNGSGRALTLNNGRGTEGTGAMPAVLPEQIEDLVHRFAYHLSRAWSEALTDASPDDTLAVIRAAAEARVREAEAGARALEDEILGLEGEMSVLRAERDGLASALDSAAERAHEAMAAEARMQTELREIQERSIARIEALQSERDAYARELEQAGRRPQLREATSGSAGASREVWPGTQGRPDGDGFGSDASRSGERVIPFPDAGKRGRDGEGADAAELSRLSDEVDKLRSDRDEARTEIARLSGERESLRQELEAERRKLVATLGKERERHQGEIEGMRTELEDLKVRAAKQSAWIREARVRMEKVGLLKPRKG